MATCSRKSSTPLDVAITTWTYDAAGNVQSSVDPLGNVYNADPNAALQQALLHTINYSYDGLNRKIEEKLADADGLSSTPSDRPTTVWTYNSFGELQSFTDAAGNITSYTDDRLGRKIGESNHLSQVRSFVYDLFDNVIRITDRNGRVREFEYDAMHRQSKEKWLSGGIGTSIIKTFETVYDVQDRVLNRVEKDSSGARPLASC